MNIRQAFLDAADYIEYFPGEYEFTNNGQPKPECGTPGCMLGWVGFFLGIRPEHPMGEDETYADVVAAKIGTTLDEFLLERLCAVGEGCYTSDAFIAARTMRAYADKYHPEAA